MSNSSFNGQGAEYSAPLPWQLPVWQQLSEQFENSQLAHAYLFYGGEGLGKSRFVSSFAHYMLCQDRSGKTACGTCASCKQGGIAYHPDILEIAPEEGSKDIKIDQIRALSEFAIRTSHTGAAKIIIIHQAHQLNSNAANALLKTLEEPSHNTYLFLISDMPGCLVATIRSRCQQLNFPLPSREQASEWLQAVLGNSAGNDELLDATANNPIQALLLADGDQLQARQKFLSSLCDLALGRVSIQSVLSLTSKIGELEVLRYLSSTSSILVKCLLGNEKGNEKPQGIERSTEALYAAFSSPQSNSDSITKRLLQFYSEVELARRQLAASTNPNPQLIMESLLWHWSKIARNR